MSIVEKIMQAVEDTIVDAKVDFPAGREAGVRIAYDTDELRQKIEAVISLATKETLSGTVDTDTPLMAAAREAGWALMELVNDIDWEKRDQVSDIIGTLGAALTATDTNVMCFNPTHRHKKRGSAYEVIGLGHLQVDGDLDMEMVTIYRGEDGRLWARPEYEFNDGRFEAVVATEGSDNVR